MGNNEHRHKNNKVNKKRQKNSINDKEKINTTKKGNGMKKVQVQMKCQAKINGKTPEYKSSNQKYSTFEAKLCPGINLIFFRGA